MVTGLIHDVSSCADLMGTIMADANRLIRERLAGCL